MKMCSRGKKKMQQGNKKRGKERYEEVRLKKISSISGSVYSQGLKWKESSDNNRDGREETE